jgi:hypothetical protein
MAETVKRAILLAAIECGFIICFAADEIFFSNCELVGETGSIVPSMEKQLFGCVLRLIGGATGSNAIKRAPYGRHLGHN